MYLGLGNYVHGPKLYEVGLLSAHTPGSSGGGSWGFDGNRRLIIVNKKDVKNIPSPIDPEKWIKYTSAMAFDRFGELEFKTFDDSPSDTLLRIAIGSVKSS